MTARVQIIFENGRLEPDWTHVWSQELADELTCDPAVADASVRRLRPVSDGFEPVGDWLLDVELAPGADPDMFVESDATRDVLNELRQLRLRPHVQLLVGP